LKPSIRAKQAHFTNQKSTILNRQSKQKSVAAHQQLDKKVAFKC